MYKLLLFITLLVNIHFAGAQSSEYLFQRLGVKDGLFEETVHAIQQDAKGFLWLNFRTLIQRYDGNRMLNFYPGTQLPEGNVRAMMMDKKNRLWLLSGDATLGYLDPDNFKYHAVEVKIPKGFTSIVSGAYINRKDEMILVWDKQGFITYNNETGVADEANNPFIVPKGWEPMHIWQDDAFNYWVGTANGLLKYNASKKTLSYRGHNADNDPAIKAFEQIKNINACYVDKKNNYWVITWEGSLKILSYNANNGKQIDWAKKIDPVVNKYYVPYGFTETAGNDLWLTGISLFCKINTADESLQVIPQQSSAEYSILYDMIFTLYEDKEKNIWAGTNKGLFRFNPQGQLFNIMTNKKPGNDKAITTDVTDFLETQDGELLVSTWGNGFFSYNQKLQPIVSANLFQQNRMEGTMAWSMVQRANGDVWCSMQGDVLSIFEAATKRFIQKTIPLAEGKTIRQLEIDNNGNIWMGTQGGALIQWDASLNTFTKHLQLNALISRIYVDSNNQIWVGTDRDGLYVINSRTGKLLQHYTSSAPKNKKLLINGIADLVQYNDSVFFIAGNGLNILNTTTNRFEYFTIANGLPSANITNLLKDKNGYVWMTSGAGIVSYHPIRKKLSQYSAADGLPNYNFNSGAAGILKNGNIVFGTNRDFLVFNPDKLSSHVYLPPKVHISGIEVMGVPQHVDSISRLSVIELNANQNSFNVQTTTLHYKDYYAVHYMLEGIDKTWKEAGKANTIEYNYLPPGNYILKVTCLGEGGAPSEITSLSFHIAAPFYRQWWFYSMVALFVSGLLFWLDRGRIQRKEAIQKMRSDIATNLHREINTTLSNINILSELAKIKADKDIEKSKEFIEQIHGKSQTMLIAMDDMLWAISPENDSMEKSIVRMQEFIDAINTRYGIHIEMLVEEKVKLLKLNMHHRYEAIIMFKEGISGLLKAGAKNCNIHLRMEKQQLLYIIECKNNGCDIQQLNYYFNGQEFKNRLNAIQAKMDIDVYKSVTVLKWSIHL